MPSIDLRVILQRTVSDLFGDLVTRRTGQAVRGGIERVMEDWAGEPVVVMDFGAVRCLDISCADEIVAKLLLQPGTARCILLAGLSQAHREAIEPVLERHQLAVVVVDPAGRLELLGALPDPERRVFDLVVQAGAAEPDEVAARLELPAHAAQAALDQLVARRLVLESEAGAFRAPSPA
jgi:hypothetical protein